MPLHKWIDIPPTWLFACIGIVWMQAAWLPQLTWHSGLTDHVGGLLIGAGLMLMALAVWEFYKAKTTPVPHQNATALITGGIFRLTRNPIYLGDLLVLAGIILRAGAWPCLPLIPALTVLLARRFIEPEEIRLATTFGTDFTDWTAKTRRWV